jgi:hypothetical protein
MDAARRNAQLYVRLAGASGGDEFLREFASHTRPGQPSPLILLASVHYLLIRGAEHPLRRFYPDLNGGYRVESEDPFPVFKDFVETHKDELAPLIASGVTNTNEVGRSGLLHAGFRALAAEAGEPLHLVEIGPSAGLNMIWDRYGVIYKHGNESYRIDTPNPALTIELEARGENIPPLGPSPKVASRVGLELNPVDLSKQESRDWLKALVWPDHVSRIARLDAALKAFVNAKPEILAGSALDLLPEALSPAPANEPVCVYHTLVTYQFTQEMRDILNDILVAVSTRRPVWRLSIEGTPNGDNPMLLYRYHDGVRDKRTLALCDPHGAWIEWLA